MMRTQTAPAPRQSEHDWEPSTGYRVAAILFWIATVVVGLYGAMGSFALAARCRGRVRRVGRDSPSSSRSSSEHCWVVPSSPRERCVTATWGLGEGVPVVPGHGVHPVQRPWATRAACLAGRQDRPRATHARRGGRASTQISSCSITLTPSNPCEKTSAPAAVVAVIRRLTSRAPLPMGGRCQCRLRQSGPLSPWSSDLGDGHWW